MLLGARPPVAVVPAQQQRLCMILAFVLHYGIAFGD